MTSSPPQYQILPKALQDWRYASKPIPHPADGQHQRPVWDPLFPFFKKHGLHLFDYIDYRSFTPPDERARQPDGFVHRTSAQVGYEDKYIYISSNGNMCPARTSDGRDVLIRLVAQGPHGHENLTALRRIASGPQAMLGENYCVPMLHELTTGDMTFAVFPLMKEGFDRPYFFDWDQALDCIEQLSEGVKVFHEHLIAHLDIDGDNILINCQPGRRYLPNIGPPESQAERNNKNFRSTFPIRYCWNDFELAACFDATSDPATRTIVGLPTKRAHRDGEYGRTPAPEFLEAAPYCPFKADIWMLGQFFKEYFGNLQHFSPDFFALVDKRQEKNPADRPSANEVFAAARHARHQASAELLETEL